MRAFLCALALLVAVASGADGVVNNPLTVTEADGTTLLNVDPRFMWGWFTAEASRPNRFSVEISIQAAALHYGTWASAELVREAVSGATGNQTALTFADVVAVSSALGLESVAAAFSTGDGSEQLNGALNFTAYHLGLERPVAIGAFEEMPAAWASSDYDHALMVLGMVENTTAGASGTNASLVELHVLDWFVEGPRVLEQPLGVTRAAWTRSNQSTKPYAYNLPSTGLNVATWTGVADPMGQHFRTSINATQFQEPDVSPVNGAVSTAVNVTVSINVFGLTTGRFYAVLRFDGDALPADGNFATASNVAKRIEFEANGTTAYLHNADSFASDGRFFYRTINIAAPPPTPVPDAVIFRNATCPEAQTGVYNLDSSAAFCPVIAQCRKKFCTCIGAPDGNSCWLRNRANCDVLQTCTADLTHCIDLGGTNSTTSSCQELRDEYNASLPTVDPTTGWTYDGREFLASAVGQSCQAIACEIFRQSSDGESFCALNTNDVCMPPGIFHGVLELEGTAEAFEAILNNSVTYAEAKAALLSDLTALFGRTVTVKGFTEGSLVASFYLPGVNNTDAGVTAAVVTGATDLTWLTAFQAVYASNGGTDLELVAFGETELATGGGFEALLADCSAGCVAGIAVTAIVICLLVLCCVAYCRYRISVNKKMKAADEAEGLDEEEQAERAAAEEAQTKEKLTQSSPELRLAIRRANKSVSEMKIPGAAMARDEIARIQNHADEPAAEQEGAEVVAVPEGEEGEGTREPVS